MEAGPATWEVAMHDWAGEIADRNYGIKRITDPQKLSELLAIIFSLALIAATLLFYAWNRSQIVSIGYASQQLQAQEEYLLHEERSLVLEEQTLKNPERIEAIARTQLGMIPLRASQLLTPQLPGVAPAGPVTLALAESSGSTVEARKSSATN
jgi:cell division protein FtsL